MTIAEKRLGAFLVGKEAQKTPGTHTEPAGLCVPKMY
jgi:hypothetical protein